MLRLIVCAILYGLIPILAYYLYLRLMEWNKKQIRQQRAAFKKSDNIKLQALYDEERKPYYKQAYNLFHDMLKNKALSRGNILTIKKMLNSDLGNYTKEYNQYWKNDAEEIYKKMKSIHIDKNDWIEIINYLQNVG